MSDFEIEIEGMDELTKVLADIAKKYPKQVMKGCADTGLFIEREAKLNETRVDTGNLRSSIRTNIDDVHQEVTVTAGGSSMTRDVDYAVYQEFGTRFMEGLFYMTRAAETGFRRLAEFVQRAIEQT